MNKALEIQIVTEDAFSRSLLILIFVETEKTTLLTDEKIFWGIKNTINTVDIGS